MFAFTDAERAYLSSFDGIIKDSQEREVLRGLTFDETAFHVTYGRRRNSGEVMDPEDTERYLELDEKFQAALAQLSVAEAERRNEKPTEH